MWWLYVLIFFFGLGIGSFLNVIIFRLPRREKIVWDRSHCVNCHHDLGFFDLWPLLSFIFCRGRCRYCQSRISWQYPVVELVTGLLFVVIFYLRLPLGDWLVLLNGNFWWWIIRDWILVSFLIVIFVIDWRQGLIFDRVTIPAIIIILLINLLLLHEGVWFLLLAAVVSGGFFGLQYLVSSGRWIGDGDIRLGVLMGVALSWPKVIVGLFSAYIIGAIGAIALIILRRKKLNSTIPFGTFLAIGTIIALWWGDKIINWYLSLVF